MSITLAAAGIAAGAASGAAGGLMSKGTKAPRPKYTEHEKQLTATSTALAPVYMNLLAGRSTPFLDRLLQQQKSLGAQQTQQGVQGFLRRIGQRGGSDFGPGAYSQLSKIYQGATPAVMAAVNQARMAQTQQAMTGLQQWSMIKPGTMDQGKKPSMGAHIGAGALGGLSQGMGGIGKPKGAGAAAAAAPAAQTSSQTLQSAGVNPSNFSLNYPQAQPAGGVNPANFKIGGSQPAGGVNPSNFSFNRPGINSNINPYRF